MITDNIVTWETRFNIADSFYFKTQVLLVARETGHGATVVEWPVAEVGRVGRQAERGRFKCESKRRARESAVSGFDVGRVKHRTPRPQRLQVEDVDGVQKCVLVLRSTSQGHCPRPELGPSRTRSWGAFKGQFFAGILGRSSDVVNKI